MKNRKEWNRAFTFIFALALTAGILSNNAVLPDCGSITAAAEEVDEQPNNQSPEGMNADKTEQSSDAPDPNEADASDETDGSDEESTLPVDASEASDDTDTEDDAANSVTYLPAEVTAHFYSIEDQAPVNCLFRSDLPEVPFICIEEYLDGVFEDDITCTQISENVYSIGNEDGSFIINTATDRMQLVNYDMFALESKTSKKSGVPEDEDDSFLIADDGEYANPDASHDEVCIDFSTYGIDLIDFDGAVYMPLSTLAELLTPTYVSASFVDGEIYFVNMMAGVYYDNRPIYEIETRSKEMAEYTYNDLCFTVDFIYGKPSSAILADSIAEIGFDKTLDTFNDDTRKAKELLLSENIDDFLCGLCYLDYYLDDGGHTVFSYQTKNDLIFNYDLPLFQAFKNMHNNENGSERTKYLKYFMFSGRAGDTMKQKVYYLSREEAYANYQEIKLWSMGNESDDNDEGNIIFARLYQYKNDTAIFAFDSFAPNAIEPFVWSLNYAKENGIRNFVIDLTMNGGGLDTVLKYIMCIVANDDEFVFGSTLTKENVIYHSEADKNLDGYVDEKDTEINFDDLNFAFLTSSNCFSCGHVLPSEAKQDGVMLIGEKTGGGVCTMSPRFLANGYQISLSGPNKYMLNNGEDCDHGTEPNEVITEGVSREDVINVSEEDLPRVYDLYDMEKITALMDKFYDKQPENPVKFATPEEVAEMAKTDYKKKNGLTPAESVVTETDDNTYSVVLKDKNGKTLDTYTLDTATGVGTDSNGKEVNLPQTGMTGAHKTVAGIAVLLLLSGAVLVKKSKKEDKQ